VLNRSFHSVLTATLGGAKKRIGWSGFEGRDFMLSVACKYDHDKPEIECFLDVFRAAAGEIECNPNLELWLDQQEVAEAAEHLPQGDFLLGIQPGATHEYKQWPRASFVSMCERIVEHNDRVRIVLIGGGDEEAIAQSFLAEASPKLAERVTNLVGRLSLRTTLGVVSQLHGFIGNDTAIRHAAVALNVPSIGLFGPTNKSKWGNANAPRHIVVSSTTGKMEDISVDLVLAESSLWFDNAPTPVSAGARYE
jgi:ADP-heptose:LPS heptosyltransferase